MGLLGLKKGLEKKEGQSEGGGGIPKGSGKTLGGTRIQENKETKGSGGKSWLADGGGGPMEQKRM